jgi:hypothetical protein
MQPVLPRPAAGRDEHLVPDHNRAGKSAPRQTHLPGHVLGIAERDRRSCALGDSIGIIATELPPIGNRRGREGEKSQEGGELHGGLGLEVRG